MNSSKKACFNSTLQYSPIIPKDILYEIFNFARNNLTFEAIQSLLNNKRVCKVWNQVIDETLRRHPIQLSPNSFHSCKLTKFMVGKRYCNSILLFDASYSFPPSPDGNNKDYSIKLASAMRKLAVWCINFSNETNYGLTLCLSAEIAFKDNGNKTSYFKKKLRIFGRGCTVVDKLVRYQSPSCSLKISKVKAKNLNPRLSDFFRTIYIETLRNPMDESISDGTIFSILNPKYATNKYLREDTEIIPTCSAYAQSWSESGVPFVIEVYQGQSKKDFDRLEEASRINPMECYMVINDPGEDDLSSKIPDNILQKVKELKINEDYLDRNNPRAIEIIPSLTNLTKITTGKMKNLCLDILAELSHITHFTASGSRLNILLKSRKAVNDTNNAVLSRVKLNIAKIKYMDIEADKSGPETIHWILSAIKAPIYFHFVVSHIQGISYCKQYTDFLYENTGTSFHEICLDGIIPTVTNMLNRIKLDSRNKRMYVHLEYPQERWISTDKHYVSCSNFQNSIHMEEYDYLVDWNNHVHVPCDIDWKVYQPTPTFMEYEKL